MKPEQHGTLTGYAYGCRCGECKAASSAEYKRRNVTVDREALGEFLRELFPLGLTNDCPARASLRT